MSLDNNNNNNNTHNGPEEAPTVSDEIEYVVYKGEQDLEGIISLIEKDLSEPYSVYTYRYFINNWPHLCFLAKAKGETIGTVVAKMDTHRLTGMFRGYIAMLAVHKEWRKRKIGTRLVAEAIKVMQNAKCEEVVLETEITNGGALALYINMGFTKDKRLVRYYMNGVDAFRLKLSLPLDSEEQPIESAPNLTEILPATSTNNNAIAAIS